MAHALGVIDDAAPVTVPIRRVEGMDWPGEGEVAFVPAALMLAAYGRCTCTECTEGFVRLLARRRLRAV